MAFAVVVPGAQNYFCVCSGNAKTYNACMCMNMQYFTVKSMTQPPPEDIPDRAPFSIPGFRNN
jgi:hypothetical protein